MSPRCTSIFLCLIFPGLADAQVDRYDIGRKLISFEKSFSQASNLDNRKRATPALQKAFSSFMSGRLGEVGRVLDEAQWALEGVQPSPAMGWAASIVFRPSYRMFDPTLGQWTCRIQGLYEVKSDVPDQARARVILLRNNGELLAKPIEQNLKQVPSECAFVQLPIESGDFVLRGEVLIGSEVLSCVEHVVSLATDLQSRLGRLRHAVEQLPASGLTTDQRTLQSHLKLLENLAKGNVSETVHPAERLLREAETLAYMPAGDRFFESNRTGQYWLTLATARPASIRLQVPEASKKGGPMPLVIALHGAGGSENMFFDAYGHGEVARQCAQRGWLLVATRTEFFASPPIVDIVDELAKLYPVDKSKVFLVGHSMGAGQALALARQHPDKWSGVAALGGGGRMNPTEPMKRLPFFIGCGTDDFALKAAKATAKSLLEAGVEKVDFRDYPDIEHIAIVQVALPDVFKWYDSLITK